MPSGPVLVVDDVVEGGSQLTKGPAVHAVIVWPLETNRIKANRLARHHVPVPKPFDEILLALLSQAGSRRSDVATAWLLPGRVPGQPISAQALRVRLKAHGLPVRAGKNGELAVLVAELPAALVAETIGIHPTTANRWASHTATRWRQYARRVLDASTGQTASSPVPGR